MAGTIQFRSPASEWQDALPIGNGRTAALFFGGIPADPLVLGHSGCWLAPEPRPKLPTAMPDLSTVRRLLREGKPDEAERMWLERCRANRIRYVGADSCHPAAGLTIALDSTQEPTGYRRWLDPSAGIAGADWHDAGGEPWHRRAWVDRVADVVVWEQSAPRPTGATVTMDTVGAGKASVWISSTYPSIDAAGWTGHCTPVRDLVDIEQWTDNDTAWLRGRYRHTAGGWLVGVAVPGAVWSGSRAAAPPRTQLRVFCTVNAHPDMPPDVETLRQRLIAVTATSSIALSESHARAHGALFGRCRIQLTGETPKRSVPVEDMLTGAADGNTPTELWEQLWAMGRTTFIASAAEDSEFPPHLQGIWTGTWRPPWFGCYTNDENVQMMHWQAVSGNLAPLLAPLRRRIKASIPQWRENAKSLFGCSGVLAPLQQGGTWARHQQAEWQGWTGGAGWLARHVWDAWLLDRDPGILHEELLPLLREVIAFYEDFLERDRDGIRHAIPSVSVENTPKGWPNRWTIDATMEIAIVREVLRHARVAAGAAGVDVPESWSCMEQSLPGYRVNMNGELAEWTYPSHDDNHEHRHLSHIYPLFPGDEFGPEAVDLRAATRLAVAARASIGQLSQTGWSLAHMAHIHARLGNGAAAQRCLELLVRSCLQTNLLTVHNDWRAQGLTLGAAASPRGTLQLDALYGATSAMQECLIQSEANWVALLPALLPAWRRGSAAGLGTRCGVVADISWDAGSGTASATLVARRPCRFRLYRGTPAPGQETEVSLAPDAPWHGTWNLP